MLRNTFKFHQWLQARTLYTTHTAKSKDNSVKRQGKILGKLFGARVAGTKKRWFPDGAAGHGQQQAIFQAANLAKPVAGGGKQTSHRMTVLNKLFMHHITDQMANGGASDAIAGHGIQVTRVKISPDFAFINVYWMGGKSGGNPLSETALEEELHRFSGKLRHELSQLGLMGEVPHIRFVRDNMYSNIEQVDAILSSIDFGPDEAEMCTENNELSNNSETNLTQHKLSSKSNSDVLSRAIHRDLYGPIAKSPEDNADHEFPAMRHDVLGLNHKDIMNKIHVKMRKSKDAWEQHYNADSSMEASTPTNTLAQLSQKLTASAEANERFNKFLAKRRERKETPERKKYNRLDHQYEPDYKSDGDMVFLSDSQRKLYFEDDYLNEETFEDDKRKS